MGNAALDANTVGDKNVAIGMDALGTNIDGSRSVAVGDSALATQEPASAVAMYNTAVGHAAGNAVTTGTSNTLIGGLAGDAITDADYNVAVGAAALGACSTSPSNTAVGKSAGGGVTTGNGENVFVGNNAGLGVTTGAQSIFIGDNTAAGGTATGVSNVIIGDNAGYVLSSGAYNTMMGIQAGYGLTSGNNNLFLGIDAGRTGSPGGSITTGSNEIVLGDENITESHIQVDWTIASDERDKTDFTALDLGLDFVKALAPVTYKWDKRSKYIDKDDPSVDLDAVTHDGTHKEDWLDVGFKAQEVETLEKAAGYKIADKTNLMTSLTDDGKQYGLQYSKFVPILVKAIQEQQTTIEALTARIAALES